MAEQYLKKGSTVYIEGQLQTRKYEQNGVEKYSTEIVLQKFRGELTMLGGKGDGGGRSYEDDGGGFTAKSGAKRSAATPRAKASARIWTTRFRSKILALDGRGGSRALARETEWVTARYSGVATTQSSRFARRQLAHQGRAGGCAWPTKLPAGFEKK